MKLFDCDVGFSYKIMNVNTESKRLISLGLECGREVTILFKSSQNIVVSLLGSIYALEPRLAKVIEVSMLEVKRGG